MLVKGVRDVLVNSVVSTRGRLLLVLILWSCDTRLSTVPGKGSFGFQDDLDLSDFLAEIRRRRWPRWRYYASGKHLAQRYVYYKYCKYLEYCSRSNSAVNLPDVIDSIHERDSCA